MAELRFFSTVPLKVLQLKIPWIFNSLTYNPFFFTIQGRKSLEKREFPVWRHGIVYAAASWPILIGWCLLMHPSYIMCEAWREVTLLHMLNGPHNTEGAGMPKTFFVVVEEINLFHFKWDRREVSSNHLQTHFFISWLWWKEKGSDCCKCILKKKNLSGFGLTLVPLCCHGLPLVRRACQVSPPPPIGSHDLSPTGCDAIATDRRDSHKAFTRKVSSYFLLLKCFQYPPPHPHPASGRVKNNLPAIAPVRLLHLKK